MESPFFPLSFDSPTNLFDYILRNFRGFFFFHSLLEWTRALQFFLFYNLLDLLEHCNLRC